MKSPRRVYLRPLTPKDEDATALQSVFEAAPSYSRIVTGDAAKPGDAKRALTALPPGKLAIDKHFLGIYLEDRLIGCIDLICGWPNQTTAHIGLLLLDEGYQGQGVGAEAFRELEAQLHEWGNFSTLRIGVVKENTRAFSFWHRMGFTRTGEVKPYQVDTVHSEVVVLQRSIHNAG